MFVLPGENIFLRTPGISDAEKIFQWENDPGNIAVNAYQESLSKIEIIDWIANSHHDLLLEKELRLMICTERNEVVGCIDLFQFDPIHLSAGVGILVERKYRQKNFAKRSLLLVKNHCFEKIKLNSLWCNISSYNTISIGLFSKCGFVLTGSSSGGNRKEGFIPGAEHLFFQCLKPE